MDCIQECQTFLWAGSGTPAIDGTGSCSCVCGHDGWYDFNILGRASCVPTTAHVTFGVIGLATSVAGLSHAVYQLYRQVGGRCSGENLSEAKQRSLLRAPALAPVNGSWC